VDVPLHFDVALAETLEEDEGVLHVDHLLVEFLLFEDSFRLVHEHSLHDLLAVDEVIVSIGVVDSLAVVLLLLGTEQVGLDGGPTVFDQDVDLSQKQVEVVAFNQVKHFLLDL
jgi:hypothetical protein